MRTGATPSTGCGSGPRPYDVIVSDLPDPAAPQREALLAGVLRPGAQGAGAATAVSSCTPARPGRARARTGRWSRRCAPPACAPPPTSPALAGRTPAPRDWGFVLAAPAGPGPHALLPEAEPARSGAVTTLPARPLRVAAPAVAPGAASGAVARGAAPPDGTSALDPDAPPVLSRVAADAASGRRRWYGRVRLAEESARPVTCTGCGG